MKGSISAPLARIKGDEKNSFGTVELKAVREAASRFLTKHTAAAWKHRKLSHVEQEGFAPVPKDRGAEQGDVDGPLECSLALGMVAGMTAARQAAGTLLWIGVDDPTEEQRSRADHAARVQESVNFQPGGPEKLTGAHDPQHALQQSGGLADQWYMDNGDIMCHSTLVLLFLQDFDVVNAVVGAERNPLKTEVIDNVIALGAEWKIDDVKKMINNSTVTDGSNTLSVVVGPRQHIADQLFQVCQDPQTSERVWEAAAPTTFCWFTATQSWRNRGLQRSMTRSGSGLSTGSSRVSQRTA